MIRIDITQKETLNGTLVCSAEACLRNTKYTVKGSELSAPARLAMSLMEEGIPQHIPVEVHADGKVFYYASLLGLAKGRRGDV